MENTAKLEYLDFVYRLSGDTADIADAFPKIRIELRGRQVRYALRVLYHLTQQSGRQETQVENNWIE